MALEETVDNLDGVDSKYKDLYVENSDGKFEVNISGLKSALTKERELKKEFEKKVTKLANVPDPDKDELKTQLKTAIDKISDMSIRGKVKTAAIKAGIDPDYVDDVVLLTKGKFKEDDAGDIISVDSSGTPTGRNVEAFFKNDFKKSKPRYFVSSGRKGTGAQSSDILPTTFDGKLTKAIKAGDVSTLVKLKQSKLK
jgi:flagellar hook-basal body complex protein FliE